MKPWRAVHFRADVIEGLKHPTFEDKRRYLELLQLRVMVKDGRAVIRCALSIDAIEVNLTSGLTSVLFEVSSTFESLEGEYVQNEGSVEA